jgi:hypothetical protein
MMIVVLIGVVVPRSGATTSPNRCSFRRYVTALVELKLINFLVHPFIKDWLEARLHGDKRWGLSMEEPDRLGFPARPFLYLMHLSHFVSPLATPTSFTDI